MTVLPAAFGKGAPSAARVVGASGLLLLLSALFFERKWPSAGKIVSIWGLVATSLIVWIVVPSRNMALDPVQRITGMIGWALFALAHVAPALPRRERVVADEPFRRLEPRGDSGRLDACILGGGILLALFLQCVGWGAEQEAERAVLVRLVSLASGVAIIGASTSIVVSRHTPRQPLSQKKRAKRAIIPLVLVSLWVAAGAIYEIAVR